jgi:ABC-type transport system substrate-binding protein
LNASIDRTVFVEQALMGHGEPSTGPVWPRHWALQGNRPNPGFDPELAARVFSLGASDGRPQLEFKCLVTSNDERVALVVKQQLQAVGANMVVEEVSIDQINQAAAAGNFDAILAETISGPNIFRPYLWWHSRGTRNRTKFANSEVDAALDSIRHSVSDDDYRSGVIRFQQAILDDPPAIFLAWPERARAVSRRFEVSAEPRVDVLGTLRTWRPLGEPTTN